jgi:hypothetical protein
MTLVAPLATLFRDTLRREFNVPDPPTGAGGARHRRAEPPVLRRPV